MSGSAALIRQYGYIALFFGTFFEGEVILSLGGAAASQGYLSLALVMAAGAAGTVASDQTCFWGGRLFGRWFLERYPIASKMRRTSLPNSSAVTRRSRMSVFTR